MIRLLVLILLLLLLGCGRDTYNDCLKRETLKDRDAIARGESQGPFYTTPQARCQD